MKRTEETIDLRQSYDEIIALMQNDKYEALMLAAKNQNHKVMELLLDYAKTNSIDIKEALKHWDYLY